MPTYQLLTDRTLAQSTAITPTTLIHIVTTADTSQSIYGSSYKAELQQLSSIFSGNTDTFLTGGTYSAGTITFTNNTGGTFNVTGLTTGSTSTVSGNYLPLSGGTVTGNTVFNQGLTASTLSASTFFVNGVQITGDTFVTGGTFSAGTITFNNNQNNQFTVTGITSSGTTFTGGTVSGQTNFTNGLTANTISATTYQNLPTDIRVTGASYSDNTFTFTNNTGGTFNTSFNTVTGLTVNGGLSATTISATTYLNLPLPPFTNVGSASTVNWNISGGSNNYKVVLTANTTLNVLNVRDGEYGTIIVRQDSVGGRTITLGTINGTSGSGRHLVSSGSAGLIYLTNNPNAFDILSFVYDGNTLYWSVGNDYT